METVTIRLDDALSSVLADATADGRNKSEFIREAIRGKIKAEGIFSDGEFPSKPQRTIMYLLLEILANKKGQNFISQDGLENLQTAIFEGYAYDYSNLNPVRQDTFSSEVVHEVRDILFLHRVLANTFKDYCNSLDLPESDIRFEGFDGNDESAHYSYASFVLGSLGEFKELADVNDSCENTHWPILDTYRAMLREWKQCKNQYKLTKAEFVRITNVKARTR